jgi:hypothetical protein
MDPVSRKWVHSSAAPASVPRRCSSRSCSTRKSSVARAYARKCVGGSPRTLAATWLFAWFSPSADKRLHDPPDWLVPPPVRRAKHFQNAGIHKGARVY